MNTHSTFKRLAVGDTFISNKTGDDKGSKYRKHDKHHAILINPATGRGNTAQPVKLSASHAVLF